MDTKHTLSTTQARKKLFQLTKEVQTPGISYTFTENGVPQAVLMSAEEFESWQETLEVLSENPNLAAELKQSQQEYDRGEYVDIDDLIKASGQSHLVSEKKGKYVSGQAHQKRSQATKKVK